MLCIETKLNKKATMRRGSKEQLKHLIYISRPVHFDATVVGGILTSSKENNKKSGVTGALIYRQDLYLQFLEGPEDQVDQTYKKIFEDPRHKDLKKLRDASNNRRLFSSWAMRGDPIETWMWSYEDVKNGLLNRLSSQESLDVFEKLSRNVDQFN